MPQSSILVNGLLTLFQSTSVAFWYQFVKNITLDNAKRLGASDANVSNKLETLGKKEGSREATNRLLEVMKTSKKHDHNASMIMYQYTNANEAALKKQLIPNFTLNFLHEAAKQGLDKDIKELTLWEVESKSKPSYRYTFFSRITEREDYRPLYPSEKSNGASPELFLLYQTHILKYPTQSLYTAYKIAQFLKSKDEVKKLSVDIQRNHKKQTVVKKWIIEMAKEGLISFDEYYNMFIHSSLDRRNRRWLIKYYLLSQSEIEFKNIIEDGNIYNPEYRDRIIKVGTMMFDRILEEKGPDRFKKLLSKFAKGTIGRNWLITQFEKFTDDNEDFDYSDNWRMLCVDDYGREDIYRFLYLLRLLFTICIYKEMA